MRSTRKRIGSAFAVSALAMTFACSSSSTPAADDDAGGNKGDAPATSSGAPKCTGGMNAYETYKLAGFQAVTAQIFVNVGADKTGKLGSSFGQIGMGKPGTATADDAATFAGKLNAFLVGAYGGPSSSVYTDGKTYDSASIDITAAHTGLAITADQYDYFVTGIIVPALEKVGVTSADVTACFAPVITGTTGAGFMASIVGH
jgi:hypothetical protein